MLTEYKTAAIERETLSIPPMPLTANQVQEVTALLQEEGPESVFLLELLTERVEPGVGAGGGGEGVLAQQGGDR